ncbi:MAG: cell division protein FtsQ [Betaproteobacteria bacterium]|nr:cell division protein FtsQ [Betaproteobacteria bacterium]
MNDSSIFRPRWSLLPGFALAAILAAGFIASIDALFFRHGDWSGGVSLQALADGDATSALSKSLQKRVRFADALVTADRVFGWVALGDLGPRVRRGCGDWLFLADELVVHPGREQVFHARLAMIERVARFLEPRSIALVVAPVPDKSRLATPYLCGIERAPALADRLQRFAAGLKARNIKAVDLLPALSARDGEGYYRTDTHWNERGARRVAEAIAANLRRWELAPSAQLTFDVTAEPERERVGDLIRLAGLDQVSRPMRPRGDLESPVRIKQIPRQAVGILDDVAAPEVTVIGTSFSRRGGFVGYMSLVLAAPVANMAQDGGGVFTAAIDYFRNPAFAETPPRVIVWEIPERLLDEPIAASDERWAEALVGPPR